MPMMSVGVVLLQLESLIGGEPLSWIAGRGSVLQALSHASDGAAETMLAVAQCHCRVMLAMVLSR
jgi:hypothetical protein